jgi:hypothetical protein
VADIEVLVSVDDAHADRLTEVAEDLRRAGMRVEQTLEGLGTLTGFCDPGNLENVRRVRGVVSVERSREVEIPPPDADVQ